jgi:hypothetical protein
MVRLICDAFTVLVGRDAELFRPADHFVHRPELIPHGDSLVGECAPLHRIALEMIQHLLRRAGAVGIARERSGRRAGGATEAPRRVAVLSGIQNGIPTARYLRPSHGVTRTGARANHVVQHRQSQQRHGCQRQQRRSESMLHEVLPCSGSASIDAARGAGGGPRMRTTASSRSGGARRRPDTSSFHTDEVRCQDRFA